MQKSVPYKSWQQALNPTVTTAVGLGKGTTNMKNMVKENAVIVLGRKGCCMSHVVKCLLVGHGVNPTIHEVDEQDEEGIVDELEMIAAGEGKHGRVHFPAVFIGGTLFGGLDQLMATHITGELVPTLKKAGALWL